MGKAGWGEGLRKGIEMKEVKVGERDEGVVGEEECQRTIYLGIGKGLVGMYALVYGCCDTLVFEVLTLKGHSL